MQGHKSPQNPAFGRAASSVCFGPRRMNPGSQRPRAQCWPAEGGSTQHGSEGRLHRPRGASDAGAGVFLRTEEVDSLHTQVVAGLNPCFLAYTHHGLCATNALDTRFEG